MTKTIEFKKYDRMIKSRAAAWSKITGVEKDEYISLGNYLFARILAEESYDPDKGAFSTYFYQTLNGHFQQLTRVITRRPEIYVEQNDFLGENEASAESVFLFSEILSTLSKDAWEVCKIVFETPGDLVSMILSSNGHKRLSPANLENYFHTKKGWTINRFRDCVSEIKGALNISK